MSKSKGNVVNPDEVVAQYGADTIRMYEMFMGPLEDEKPWDTSGITGIRRFLDKVWNLREKVGDAKDPDIERMLHKTIKKVTADTEDLKFNTAIAQMMMCVNTMTSAEVVSRESFESFVKVLSPYAPHLAEEVWEELGYSESVFEQSWPTFEERLTKDDVVEVAFQVNGKVRGNAMLSRDLSEEDAQARAVAHENVQKFLEGKEIVKVIYVPGRIVNIVVK
jgi:leucyl-tRNA synthetase